MKIEPFFDPRTWTVSYVVHDEGTGVIIDPVLDYDSNSGQVWTESVDAMSRFIEQQGLEVPYVFDTHAHADHMSGMHVLSERFGSRTGIGEQITVVQETFHGVYNLGPDFKTDGSQWDLLLADGQAVDAGPLEVLAMHTPGHTNACLTYKIGDALFVGDVLFQPDYGTARCDFPGGSATVLYDSIQKLYEQPEEMRVFTGHDYQPGGRPLAFESTISEQRAKNVQLNTTTDRDSFVEFRHRRDAELEMPKLILPSVQVNIRAGRLPEPESDGRSYLRIPVNALGGEK